MEEYSSEEYLSAEEIAERARVDLHTVKEHMKKYPDLFTLKQENNKNLYSVNSIEIIKQIEAAQNTPWWQKIFKNFRSCSGD